MLCCGARSAIITHSCVYHVSISQCGALHSTPERSCRYSLARDGVVNVARGANPARLNADAGVHCRPFVYLSGVVEDHVSRRYGQRGSYIGVSLAESSYTVLGDRHIKSRVLVL